jgi:lipopolysaccharide transport system ATP-binding protein
VTLQVQHLGKEYRLYDSPRQRLKALLTGRRLHRSHWALQDVSFNLHQGQCLGVIGDNGAGKSSLLKLLAGSLQPSTGSIIRSGRLTAILELGAGFHPDFTGRQNLYFGGSLIGISAAEMALLEPEIIEFCELGAAMDRPVKTYSSGMAVRLAFALVTAVEPQLLIIDEALAVGDQHFQKKCVERIEQFRNHGCTILFCSHSLYHVQQLCDTSLWLKGGKVQAYGPTPEVLAGYEAHVRAQAVPKPSVSAAVPTTLLVAAGALSATSAPAPAPVLAQFESVELPDLLLLTNASNPSNPHNQLPPRLDSPHLRVVLRARAPHGEQPHFGVMLEQVDGAGITSVATHFDGVVPAQDASGTWCATVTFTDLPLHTGQYSVSVFLFDSQGLVVYEERKDCARFQHIFAKSTPGLVHLPHVWS